MSYRIIKKETTNAAGESISTGYVIQKKFLFWYFNVRIKVGYCLGAYYGGISDIMIRRVVFVLSSEEKARIFLDKYVLHPYTLKYRGNKITRIVHESGSGDIYINLSNTTDFYAGNKCYEYSPSLEELKIRLDKRAIKTKKSVVVNI